MARKILIVDDDKLMRESVSVMLRGEGHETIEAEDGQKAVEMALAEHPDLIVADVRMPNMDGLTMVETLHQNDVGKTIPVIILTSDDTTGTINEALSAGVTVYLSKSNLTPESLKQQLLTALG